MKCSDVTQLIRIHYTDQTPEIFSCKRLDLILNDAFFYRKTKTPNRYELTPNFQTQQRHFVAQLRHFQWALLSCFQDWLRHHLPETISIKQNIVAYRAKEPSRFGTY